MKVVINRCYGGFSLSPKATAAYAKLKGRDCYFFVGGLSEPRRRVEEPDGLFWSAFDVPDVPDELENDWYVEHSVTTRPDDRSDPDLIKVVEELGAEAGGSCAKLEVVEIPDDVDYTIEEYDGIEWVAEKHRTWS